MHDGNHGHGGLHVHGHTGDAEQTKAVLSFMLEHNRRHAEELSELSGKLRAEGLNEAANLIDESAKDLNRGNEKLAAAAATLKGGDA
jgi:rubrerythrin